MKKYLAIILAIALLFSFAACGNQNGGEDETTEAAVSSNVENDANTDDKNDDKSDDKTEEPQTWEDKTADFENIDKLSDDPFSFQIYIDGTVIQLPCQISDLEALGYAFEGDKGETILETGYTTSVSLFTEDDNYVSLSIYNLSGESKAYKDCAVDDISIHESDSEGQKICTSTGITFGDPVEKIKDVYGEMADDYYDNDELIFITYETEDDHANKMRFCFRDNYLYEINVNTRGE